MIRIITLNLFLSLIFNISSLRLFSPLKHLFYALENSPIISMSDSIEILNDCKTNCLTMKSKFPFSFKYHRYILRQTTGITKYVEGQCLFTAGDKFGDNDWHSWKELRDFVSNTVEDVNIDELAVWQDFYVSCEDPKLKLSEDTLKVLNMTRVHSNFEYYDNGSFTNLEPFKDLNSMFDDLSGVL